MKQLRWRPLFMMMLICVTAVAVRARAFDGWQTDAQAYRITLCRDGKLDDQIIVTGALPQESGQLVRHPEGVSVKVTWRDVSPTERHWRIEATPDADSTLGVYEVQFPIVLLEQLANDGTDRLLAPYGVGKVIRDPFYAPDVEQGGLDLVASLMAEASSAEPVSDGSTFTLTLEDFLDGGGESQTQAGAADDGDVDIDDI